MDDIRYTKLLTEATSLGEEHGANAAGWLTQELPGGGRYTRGDDAEAARRVLQAIEDDGLDIAPPLSGEWADSYTLDALRADLEIEEEEYDDVADDVASAYEDSYYTSYQDEVERHLFGAIHPGA